MLDEIRRLVIGDQIIVFIIPGQCPRTDKIIRAALFEFEFLFRRPLGILKPNLHIGIDRRVNPVDIVIDRLIFGLDTVVDKHLPLQLPRLAPAGQLFQLPDQLIRFLSGDKFGRLYRIDQQFELRHGEHSLSDIISCRRSLSLYDIHSHIPQGVDIRVNALAFRRNPILFQLRAQLFRR